MGNVLSTQVSGDLVSINEKLQDYMAAWDAYVDAWLVVKVGTPEWVHRWRLQAEHAMRDSGKPGMTDEQVAHPLQGMPNILSIRVKVLQLIIVNVNTLRRLSGVLYTVTIAVTAQKKTCGLQ